MNIQDELTVVRYEPDFDLPDGFPVYNTPITPRENYYRYARREDPLWIPSPRDIISILPRMIPDVRARGLVSDGDPVPFDPDKDAGGLDMYGIDWVWVPTVGGSMVKPGSPFLEEIDEWRSKVKKPDLDSWGDWAALEEQTKPYWSGSRMVNTIVYTGIFERLISMMDFENSAMALIDDDEKEGLHELFDFYTSVNEELLEYLHRYIHADMVTFHDDWGSQRAPFFSLNTCMEMLVPYLKRVVDKAHSLGMVFTFHCCGMNEPLVPAMIEAGVDLWSGQPLNNWDTLSPLYGDKIFFDACEGPYNEEIHGSRENYLKVCFEKWQHYTKDCPGVLFACGRKSFEFADGELFKLTYPISRELLNK